MSRKIKFEDLSKTVVCPEDEKVLEVARILRDTRVRHLIVLNKEEKPVGIVSHSDLVTRVIAENKDPSSFKAGDIMTRNVIKISIDTEISDAIQEMSDKKISSLPVVDKDQKLVGVLEFVSALKNLSSYEKELKRADQNGA